MWDNYRRKSNDQTNPRRFEQQENINGMNLRHHILKSKKKFKGQSKLEKDPKYENKKAKIQPQRNNGAKIINSSVPALS